MVTLMTAVKFAMVMATFLVSIKQLAYSWLTKELKVTLVTLRGPKCTGTIGREYFGTSSCVLCREIDLNSEHLLSEISL